MELYYNTTIASSTGQTPFHTVYGYEPRMPVQAAVESSLPSVNEEMERMTKTWEEVQRELRAAQER